MRATDKLCEAPCIAEKQKAILLTAAWFHDPGFMVTIDAHEEAGAELAASFLTSKGVTEDDMTLVKSCILATCYPQKPATILEEILCDADLLYLGDHYFFIRIGFASQRIGTYQKKLLYGGTLVQSQSSVCIGTLLSHR